MSKEIINGAHSFCPFPEILLSAQSDFEAQPSLTVAVRGESGGDSPGIVVHVRREIDAETRAGMIEDPAPLISEVEEHLDRKPCMFLQTGQCAIALFLVEKAARRPL